MSQAPFYLDLDATELHTQTPATDADGRDPGAVTIRSLVCGALLSATLGVAAPYENLLVSGSPLHLDYSTPAAVFFFLLFLLIVNPVAALLRWRWRFSGAELATVYIMAAVACTLPTGGLVANLLPHISAGTYFSTPENGWAEQILPFVPEWMRVTDPKAIKWFYEGLPAGTPVPWHAWAMPLLGWMPMLLAAYGSMTCLMVLVRRQWIEHERLTFPLAQVPISMIGEPEGENSSLFGDFFRSPAAWMGILLPLLQYSLRALHNYYPSVPEGVPIWKYFYFWDGKFQLRWSISHAVVGFGFLLSTKLGFSMWFLGLLTTLERAVLLHYAIPGTQRVEGIALGSTYLAYQGFGALMVLAASALWVARPHLSIIWQKVVTGTDSIDDGDEILSYRQAVGLLLGCTVVMCVWLYFSGMSWWLAPFLVLITLGVMFGLTRIVAEGGLAVTKAPLYPVDAAIGSVGSSSLGHANLGAMGLAFPWGDAMRVTLMAAVIHGLRLAEHYVTAHRRRLFFAILIAVIAASTAAAVTILQVGYRHGALNLSVWFFGEGAATAPYKFAAYHLTNPTEASWDFFGVAGLGGAAQWMLTLASKRWLWFPIHPVAFPISAMWTTHHLMPSIFIAWLVKSVVLRYGGVTLYRRTRPFFLGLILGHYAAGGLWCVIDGFTGMTGNHLFFW
ncbi:MAG TPA: DUF6785 family protein [Candidatus Latescibacteria bacterium]|nr:DUF6785 family protein [Candidatus Latescibacterota bacterium]